MVFLILRHPPASTRTATLFPYTTLFRSHAASAGTFILGGAVNGVVGFGLPTVSLALLTVAFGLPQAMALMLAPAFVSNVWQAFSGGGTLGVLRRIDRKSTRLNSSH